MKNQGHTHNVTVKSVDRKSPTQVLINLSVDGETYEQEQQRTLRKYAKAADLPGFRQGKAPLDMVMKKYAEKIQGDVISHLLEAGLADALDQTNLVPVSRPQVKIEKVPAQKGEPLEFGAEFEVQPEIELKSYKGVPVKNPSVDPTDDEVNQTLENIRESLGVLEPVEQEQAEKGLFGVVEIHFALADTPDKKEEGKPATVELGEGRLLPEIDDALLTMKAGEKKNLEAKFPEDFGNPEFAGKSAVFDLHLIELKKKILPELNDEFASQVRQGTTLLELKKDIRENIAAQKKEESKKDQRKEIVDFLVANHKFDVPPSLVDDQSRTLLRWMYEDMKKQGMNEFPKLEDEQVKELRRRAEHMVRSSLLLKEVATKEKITLSEERYRSRVGEIATQLEQSPEATEKFLTEKGMLDRIRDEILTDQVFEFLIENAKLLDSSPRAGS